MCLGPHQSRPGPQAARGLRVGLAWVNGCCVCARPCEERCTRAWNPHGDPVWWLLLGSPFPRRGSVNGKRRSFARAHTAKQGGDQRGWVSVGPWCGTGRRVPSAPPGALEQVWTSSCSRASASSVSSFDCIPCPSQALGACCAASLSAHTRRGPPLAASCVPGGRLALYLGSPPWCSVSSETCTNLIMPSGDRKREWVSHFCYISDTRGWKCLLSRPGSERSRPPR